MPANESQQPPTIRPGTPEDARPCLDLLWASVTDLASRHGAPLEGSADDWWQGTEQVYRFLAAHNAGWWVAEDPQTRQLIGYARSIERGGLFELTEFFVRPGQQARGLGKRLLDLAFPNGRGDPRVIVATGDPRALARYYAAGTIARFPFFTLAALPAGGDPNARLTSVAIAPGSKEVAATVDIEREVLEYGRGSDEFDWLLGLREGHLYMRGDHPVGFAFVGKSGAGPMAALDPADLPDILLHVEGRARALGVEKLELEVPSVNATAVRHLLGRGFRIDPFGTNFMSSRPFGQFDRFIAFSPPLFL
jgi:GNAT superfamily N-acetyltransferase